jgi:hypothetical protein
LIALNLSYCNENRDADKIQYRNWLDAMNTGKHEIEGKHEGNEIHGRMNIPELPRESLDEYIANKAVADTFRDAVG